jgi:hypothetical protein
MQVTTAILADAATVAEGKLYVHGAGWNVIIAPQIPASHPSLALALAFKLDWHEGNEDLPIVVELVNEDGKSAGVRSEMTLRVAPTPVTKKGDDLYSYLAHTFIGLRFDEYGAYRFQVVHGGEIHAKVPLSVLPPTLLTERGRS